MSNQRRPPDSNGDGGNQLFNPNNSLWILLLVILGFVILTTIVNVINDTQASARMIGISDFRRGIEDGTIRDVEFNQGSNSLSVTGTMTGSGQAQAEVEAVTLPNDQDLIQLLNEQGIDYSVNPPPEPGIFGWILQVFGPILILLFFWRMMFARNSGGMGGGLLGVNRNAGKTFQPDESSTRFGDVAGADEAKEELVEVVDFLKNPERYTAIGGRIPKGVLLIGPPGTGKTLLARAVAGEAEVPFFHLSGADFVELFVGVGASRVRDLFKRAHEKSPAIIFIDELDAIGKSRASALSTNDEREQTLNALLVEMDGFDAKSGVIVIAATNRPEILDPALLRPGRFDRQVLVDKPDHIGRKAILEIHSRKVKLHPDTELDRVARATAGLAGADLANIVNEAALHAVRRSREQVTQDDFSEAIEKVMAGLSKKNRVLNETERKRVAYHEVGHALVAARTEGADPVEKISIVPRGMAALGYTLQLPEEDRFLYTQDELIGRIDVLLGGRASEEVIFGTITTGAANDLTRATEIARRMITEFGMSDRFRNVYLAGQQAQSFLGEAMRQRDYAETTQEYIDEEIARLMEERYHHVKQLLLRERDSLEKVSTRLLADEVIDRTTFGELLSESEQAS